MYPRLLRLPFLGNSVPAYGTMLMLGFLLAVFLARRRHRALGLTRSQVFDLGFMSVIGGIAGARLMHVIIFWPSYFLSRKFWPDWMGPFGWLGAILATWNGGLVYYGGLGGAVLGMLLYAWRKKRPFLDVVDFVAPGGAVGLAVTRVGCFLNGCCFGGPTDMPWGVTFPQGSHVYAIHDRAGKLLGFRDPFPVHPAQLYETLAALGMFALLWWLYPRRRFAGQISCIFGGLYTVWRFINEFFRADSGPWRPEVFGRVLELGPLSVFQYMSVPIFALFVTAYLLLARRGRAPYRPLDPGEGAAAPGASRERRPEEAG
jgi:phosphatidylglycerol:prolipoprotein diacylglycerol transferase